MGGIVRAAIDTVNLVRTSQVCSACGAIVEKDLSVRVHHCSACGLTLDRDVNAARNIPWLAAEPDRTGPPEGNVAGCGVRALGSSLIQWGQSSHIVTAGNNSKDTAVTPGTEARSDRRDIPKRCCGGSGPLHS